MTTGIEVRRAIGTFEGADQAEKVLRQLKEAGFDMEGVSVFGVHDDADRKPPLDQGDNPHPHLTEDVSDGVLKGAAIGSVVGGLAGLLFGVGALIVPGIGPVISAGMITTAIASALGGGTIGAVAGGLSGGLVGLGIPEEHAEHYEEKVREGRTLVMIEGPSTEVARVKHLLTDGGIHHFRIYEIDRGREPSS